MVGWVGGSGGDIGEGHERDQLIFLWPVRSWGGRLGDDGCEGEMEWKEVKG